MFPRFTESGPFKTFLQGMVVEWRSDGDCLSLVCSECSDVLCDVEADDTLGVLVATALAHDLECEAREPVVVADPPCQDDD